MTYNFDIVVTKKGLLNNKNIIIIYNKIIELDGFDGVKLYCMEDLLQSPMIQ